jgi:Icc-related predicted phosphoesterase
VTRLVCISDTHGRYPKEMPRGDVLVHAGDFGGESLQEIQRFGRWLHHHHQKYRHVVVTPGNHDLFFESDPKLAEQSLRVTANRPRLHILIDKAVSIGGLNFYGSPWTPEFNDWAFNLPRGARLREKWAKIPDDTHVLVTHGPPLFIGDLCPTENRPSLENVGCNELRERIRALKLLVHVCGHIHEGFGVRSQDPATYKILEGPGATTFVNAAFMDGSYGPNNHPIVLDVEPGVATVLVKQT